MVELPDDIYSGMRVLFKNGYGWKVGELQAANLDAKGLSFSVIDINGNEITEIDASNIFFNARVLDGWEKDLENGIVMYKEDFIKDIEEGNVTKADGDAYISDGEYQYYPIAIWTANWLNKQPFDYVVWISQQNRPWSVREEQKWKNLT